MSMKYEKPLVIPLNPEGDETGLGVCSPVGSGFSTGQCNPFGNTAGKNCADGTGPSLNCVTGTSP